MSCSDCDILVRVFRPPAKSKLVWQFQTKRRNKPGCLLKQRIATLPGKLHSLTRLGQSADSVASHMHLGQIICDSPLRLGGSSILVKVQTLRI